MNHGGQSSAGETGPSQVGASQTDASIPDASIPDAITQELVDQVADRVYAMLLAELTIEKERRRLPNRRPFRG